MSRTRAWFGTVRPEAVDEHEKFVAWLQSDDAATQYAKYGLSSYVLSQAGNDLSVRFAAEEPPSVIRFLRNPRMWPEFWEFRSADPIDEPGDADRDGDVRVRWRRGPEA